MWRRPCSSKQHRDRQVEFRSTLTGFSIRIKNKSPTGQALIVDKCNAKPHRHLTCTCVREVIVESWHL